MNGNMRTSRMIMARLLLVVIGLMAAFAAPPLE